jgi:hypothetical protein
VKLWAIVLVALAPSAVVAAETAPHAPTPEADLAPPPDDHAWRDRLVVEGLLDAYYAYQLGGAGVQTLAPHVFDDEGNSFTLAFAKVGLGVRPEPVGLRLDLGFGHVADVIAADKGATDAASVRPVEQAYLTFAVPTRAPLTIDVGKFVSSAGGEVIEANHDWNYSRSYLFGYAVPFTLTGVRATFTPVPALTLQAMIVNGWDVVFDNNGAKTLGLSASYAAATDTTLAFNGLAGIETAGADAPWRLLADVVVTQKVRRADFMLNADFVREGATRWYGVAGYARLAAAEHLDLAVRAEIFADPDGARFIANTSTHVEELTLTAAVPIAGHAELRAEVRADVSDQLLFAVGADMRDHELELLGAALAWF